MYKARAWGISLSSVLPGGEQNFADSFVGLHLLAFEDLGSGVVSDGACALPGKAPSSSPSMKKERKQDSKRLPLNNKIFKVLKKELKV